jgi:hypothetical protein
MLKVYLGRKDEKALSKHLQSMALQRFKSPDESINLLGKEFSEFLCASNKIEGINLDYDKCYKACQKFIRGYPIEDCTVDPHIGSSLKGLCMAYKVKDINSPYAGFAVHKCLDKKILKKGEPGMIRYFENNSRYGNEYSKPKDIFKHLEELKKAKNPFLKHIIFEWIHPFCDGNGRTGRLILLVDADFDFEKVNNFCGSQYLENFHRFIDKHKSIENILS